MMGALFDMWSIENVLGARKHLSGAVAELRGSDFAWPRFTRSTSVCKHQNFTWSSVLLLNA